MTFFPIFFRYIIPASALTWVIWMAIYSFNPSLMPWKELTIGFGSAFASVVSHIALALWAFRRNNAIFMGLVLGSMPLRLLLVFLIVGVTLNKPEIQKGVFVSSLLVFYFIYLFLEIYIFAKSAYDSAKTGN
jgi:hypothetical protein